MNAKQELLQALLNTSNISEEAYSLLENILNGEGGGSGGICELRVTNGWDADKTYKELEDALLAGKQIIYIKENNNGIQYNMLKHMVPYEVVFEGAEFFSGGDENTLLTLAD